MQQQFAFLNRFLFSLVTFEKAENYATPQCVMCETRIVTFCGRQQHLIKLSVVTVQIHFKLVLGAKTHLHIYMYYIEKLIKKLIIDMVAYVDCEYIWSRSLVILS